MKTYKINFFICLLLLAAAISSSACGSSSIRAQSQSPETNQNVVEKTIPSPTPVYKNPKRVSKDVILEEKPEKQEKQSKKKVK